MCLILFAYQLHPDYPLILAANRDEFFARPTQAAHWWADSPNLLAGKDLEAGGTWMGISRSGRFAAVTNVREPKRQAENKRSRGLLPLDFLTQEIAPRSFSAELQATAHDYPGYNLIFGNLQQLCYYSNRSASMASLPPGIYGVSNAGLDTPWPKVVQGKARLAELVQQPEICPEKILKLLSDTQQAEDVQLPATGVSLDWERRLSSIRICGSEYGTRTSTVLLIDNQHKVLFHEQPVTGENRTTAEFEFFIK